MNELSIKARLVITVLIGLGSYIICYFGNSDMWISITAGSAAFQIVDYSSDRILNRKKPNKDENSNQ